MDWAIQMVKGDEVWETSASGQNIGEMISSVLSRPECKQAQRIDIYSASANERKALDCAALFYEEKGKIHVSIISASADKIQELSYQATKGLNKGAKLWAAVCPNNAILYFGAEVQMCNDCGCEDEEEGCDDCEDCDDCEEE